MLDDVSVTYPSGFERDRSGTGAGVDELLNLHGPKSPDGLYMRVTLVRERRDPRVSRTVRGEGKRIAGRRALDVRKGQLVADGPVEVPGSLASKGWRVVTRFVAKTDEGDVAARITEVVALSPRYLYIYSVVGPERMLNDAQVERILGSLRVGRRA